MKGLSLRVLLPLLLWPLAEIALFVMAGDLMGFWLTLLWLAAAMVIGGALIRSSKASAARTEVGAVLRVIAGGLLILPGFLSDFVALILLLPPVRRLLGGAILKRVMPVPSSGFTFRTDGTSSASGFGGHPTGPRHPADDIIDAEATEIRPEIRPLPGQGPRSGWHQAD